MQRSEASSTKGNSLDQQSQAMLYDGLNLSQLEIILEMDKRTIKEKIFQGKVASCGTRNGFPIYRLKEVLPWVVKPHYDIENYIRNMNHSELPKHLTKEFWAGQRSKQEFELKAGNLWPTERVIQEVGELMKLVKMSALLTVDAVERQVELSEPQRLIVKNLMDGMLLDLHRAITEKFKEPKRVNEQQSDDDL